MIFAYLYWKQSIGGMDMLSKRITNMAPSATVALTAKVGELKRQGIDIISFNVGEPDFNTPANINEEAIKAINDGFTKYTAAAGIPELREAICKKLMEDNYVSYKPSQISVGTGAKQSLANAILAVCDEGDEVIVPTPCWVSYTELIKLAEGVPVLVETDESNGFQLNIEKIKAAITNRTRAIIINTPNNPTGAVYTREALTELGNLAVQHDFYVISDEVYEKLVYDGEQHVCIAALSPEIKEKTIIINGLSKAYAMTGWRIGYAAGPEDVIKGINALQSHMTSNTNSITQKAAVEALNGPQDAIAFMREKFDERRLYLFNRLANIENIECAVPKGAFYILPNVSKLFEKRYNGKVLKDSMDIAAFLLEVAHVAVVPGDSFEAPDCIRISYSNSIENIKEGMDRVEKALSQLE
jgi:aspartate aminotransferase